jgi:hypothetical protein
LRDGPQHLLHLAACGDDLEAGVDLRAQMLDLARQRGALGCPPDRNQQAGRVERLRQIIAPP